MARNLPKLQLADVLRYFCWPAMLSPRGSTGLPLSGMRGLALSASYPPVKPSLRSLLSMHSRAQAWLLLRKRSPRSVGGQGLDMAARAIQGWLETRS